MSSKPSLSAILFLSIAIAACGSDTGSMPIDGGGRPDLSSQPSSSPSDAKWTLTDGGECVGPAIGTCTLDQHPCAGQTVCRSCNAALGLWKIMPAWSCACASMTVSGSMGLYWVCPSQPVCTLDPGTFPDTFLDADCTVPAAIDAGID